MNREWVSRRLPTCDYKGPGAYFVTICTHGQVCRFGEIVEGAMKLSNEGLVLESAWQNLPQHFAHVVLDAFVIMPNHVHGILVFSEPGPTLGTVVGGFKSEVSRRLRVRVWQRYYYDHVIRSEKALNQIRLYIANNPMCWPEAGKPASYTTDDVGGRLACLSESALVQPKCQQHVARITSRHGVARSDKQHPVHHGHAR